MIKFNVIINPFSQKILVSARVDKMSCEEVLEWNGDNDWWQSFEMNGMVFDFHLLYEDELSVSVYLVGVNNMPANLGSCPTTFKLNHKDEF